MNQASAAVKLRQAAGFSRLLLSDRSVEALKWIALVCMTLDHVNKYLLGESVPGLFAVGRVALPLFALVLAHNLAREGALAQHMHVKLVARLGLIGAMSCPAFISLGGVAWGWWPLNIMFTLLAGVAVVACLARGGKGKTALALALFMVGGGLVEFWYLGVGLVVAAWWYYKRRTTLAWMGVIAMLAALALLNHNFWALAALPIVWAVTTLNLRVPRIPYFFYGYYVAHLYVLLLLKRQ